MNLAFSHAGIERLRPEDARAFDSLAFRAGIGRRDVVHSPLGAEPDILAIFASDDGGRLPSEETLRADAAESGLEIEWLEVGVNSGRREHFGFRDGVSQPAVRGLLGSGAPLAPRDPPARDGNLNGPEEAKPGQVLVWPGEFVLGYERQSARHPREPAPPLPCAPEWTRNGSSGLPEARAGRRWVRGLRRQRWRRSSASAPRTPPRFSSVATSRDSRS